MSKTLMTLLLVTAAVFAFLNLDKLMSAVKSAVSGKYVAGEDSDGGYGGGGGYGETKVPPPIGVIAAPTDPGTVTPLTDFTNALVSSPTVGFGGYTEQPTAFGGAAIKEIYLPGISPTITDQYPNQPTAFDGKAIKMPYLGDAKPPVSMVGVETIPVTQPTAFGGAAIEEVYIPAVTTYEPVPQVYRPTTDKRVPVPM